MVALQATKLVENAPQVLFVGLTEPDAGVVEEGWGRVNFHHDERIVRILQGIWGGENGHVPK